MIESVVVQGRTISSNDIRLIRRCLSENPSWHRTRLSKELCRIWNWRALNGQFKDMACRSLLLKLEKAGYIALPPRRHPPGNTSRNQPSQYVFHNTSPIQTDLKALTPIQINAVRAPQIKALFNCLLSYYHYMGYHGTVGQNMKYLVADREGNPLACLLFGSAAWKIKPRDSFIGWDVATRKRNIHLITNNQRFLILPWVRVSHLASHILGHITKRISADWMARYGHPIYLLETFVQRDRFRGTCYKAANWIYVGQTKGRTRNDRDHSIRVSIKDIYLYPLSKNFRQDLTNEV